MNFTKNDLDASILQYIDEQKNYLKKLKDIKYQFEQNYEKFKRENENKKRY